MNLLTWLINKYIKLKEHMYRSNEPKYLSGRKHDKDN